MSWKITARDAYWHPPLRRMVRVETQENEDGQARTVEFTVAKDGTRLPIHQTGYEGSLRIACAQVGINLVPVIEPRLDHNLVNHFYAQETNEERAEALAKIQADAMDKIHAMQSGTTTTFELGAKGMRTYAEITHDEAVRRYGRKTFDVCEPIPGGSGAGW